MKAYLTHALNWIAHDGKTTLVAVLYATAETLLALPDFATMTTSDFLKRSIRILAVTGIGLLAKDRLPVEAPKETKPDVNT